MDYFLYILPTIVSVTVIFGASWFYSRYAKSVEGYFVMSRGANVFLMTGTYVASLASIAAMVAMSSTAYRMGIGFNLWTWGILGIPLATFTICVPLRKVTDAFKEMKAAPGSNGLIAGMDIKPLVTPTDFLHVRFPSNFVRVIMASITIIGLTLYALGQIVGMALAFEMLGMSYKVGLVVSVVMIAFTCVQSGTPGVIVNDTINMFSFVFAGIILLLYVLAHFGGIGELVAQTAAVKPGYWSAASLVPVKTLVTFGLIYNFLSWGSPHMLQRAYAARSTRVFANATVLGSLIIVVWIWALYTAVSSGVSFFPELKGFEIDRILYLVGDKVLPPFFAGFLVAGIIAVGFSTINTQITNVAFSYGWDIYRTLIKPTATENDVLKITKIFVVISSIILLFMGWTRFAFLYEMMAWGIGFYGCILVPSFILGFYWKGVTTQAVVWGSILAAAIYITITLFFKDLPYHPFIVSFPIAVVLYVLISLITKASEKEIKITNIIHGVLKNYESKEPVTSKDYAFPITVICLSVLLAVILFIYMP